MSGGSYDYVSYKIEEAARTLSERHRQQTHVVALAKLLDRIAAVMHDIEWADSCDTSWTDKLDADIREIVTPAQEVDAAVKDARAALANLTLALERAK